MLLDFARPRPASGSPAFQYFHAWEAGDVLIWDNSQTLHQSMPYDNDGHARREYARSQARIRPPAVAELRDLGCQASVY